jgi:hypothetical protein
MATLQGKAVKNTYRQVLQIGANNVGVSGTLQPVQDGAGVNTALSLSTLAATVNGDLTITGDLIITGGGIQIKDLIDDTVAALIQNGTGITWTYNDGAATLTGNFTGTTSVVPEGSNLYYTQGRFDSAFAAKSTTNLAEGTNLYFTEARGNANFATNLAASDTNDLAEGSTNLYYTNARARTALSVTAGTGLSYDNTTGVFNLAAIPNASLTNSSITINGQAVSLGGTVTLTTTNIAEGTNLYWTDARFDSRFGTKTTTNLAEGTNLYYTQARFDTAFAAKTTTDLAEGTNLYYTDARARLALASSATGLTYANNSGVFSLTAGYAIPTTVKLGQYDIAYNRSIVSAAVTGTSTKTLSLTQQDANVITATWTDQGITTINGTANQIAATTVGNTTTLAFTNDVTMPNNLVVSGNLTINGTATYVNTESISSKDPLFEVANTNNTTDAVDIGYYGRYYDAIQERVEFTGLFRDASDAGKFKIFSGLVDEPTNVVNTTGTGYTVATLVANVDGNLNGTANAANILSTARTIAASGDAAWSVSFDGSANVTSALTLANTGVTATTYGTSTAVPTIAVDSKGRITSASNTNITFPVTTVNGFAGTVVLTTSDVAEGTNQYFTTARAQASITGAASSVVTANLTASRALVSDGSGKIAASATTTTTEIGYLAGVTSAIQTQLNGKLNLTGGTLTGGLIGTTGSFSSGGSGDTFTIGHTSGSGIALNITKNGNGEGLYINKASGSGNAATIIGTLNATTLVKSGGTASQFLKADGSVDSNAYLPLSGGTLTGALSGTSATLSSSITVSSTAFINSPLNNTVITTTDATNITNGFNLLGSSSYWGIRTATSGDFKLDVFGGGAPKNALTIAQSSGAATFSSIIGVNGATEAGWSVKSNGNLKVEGGSGTTILQINDTATGGKTWSQISAGAGNVHSVPNGTFYLRNSSDGINALSVSSGGNVGIGVTPAAWAAPTAGKVIQLGNTASIFSYNNLTTDLASNIYFNGSDYLYLQTGAASLYRQQSGEHSWFTVGSGTGGTSAGITERMRIASDGTKYFGNPTGSRFQMNASGENLYQYTNSYYIYGLYNDSNNLAIESLFSGEIRFKTAAQGTSSSPTTGTTRLSIGSSGLITISSLISTYTTLNVANMWVNPADGSVSRSTASSQRFKENIKDWNGNGLNTILALKPKTFTYKADYYKNPELEMLGLIAEEVAEVSPFLAEFENEDRTGQVENVRYATIVVPLIKAIQEQQAQIEELKALIAAK